MRMNRFLRERKRGREKKKKKKKEGTRRLRHPRRRISSEDSTVCFPTGRIQSRLPIVHLPTQATGILFSRARFSSLVREDSYSIGREVVERERVLSIHRCIPVPIPPPVACSLIESCSTLASNRAGTCLLVSFDESRSFLQILSFLKQIRNLFSSTRYDLRASVPFIFVIDWLIVVPNSSKCVIFLFKISLLCLSFAFK